MKLDGKTIQQAILQLVEDYKFEPQQVIEIVKMGIKSAFKKDNLPYRKANIEIEVDEDGEITIYNVLDVIEDDPETKDTNTQIEISDAKQEMEDIEVGEQLYIDITPEPLEFTRIGVQSAAQTIKQHLKHIEKERFFDKFQNKQGELLKGKVTKATGNTVVLDIDGASIVLPPEGQVPQREYEQGEDIFVYLTQISKGKGGITLDITQSSEEFIEAILRKIVPEVEEGVVEIKQIARIPGLKTKVVADSNDENVDPIGVLIGQGGDRIMIVSSLLDREKIDFVAYCEDQDEFIQQCFKPADVKHIEQTGNTLKLTIPENQKAMAIGKKASNIKLASKILGKRIEIV